jgi:hypothetical protein
MFASTALIAVMTPPSRSSVIPQFAWTFQVRMRRPWLVTTAAPILAVVLERQ